MPLSEGFLLEIEIRHLTVADAARYRDIRLEALRCSPEAFASTLETESEQPLSWFEQRLRDCDVFGGFREAELVGIVGYFAQRGRKLAHKGTLWGMYVRPGARNAGLARRLVETVVGHARERVELLQLSVVSENEPARRLYASLGFVEYGRERNALKQDGRYYDEVLMARSFAEPQAAHLAGSCKEGT